MNRSHSTPWGWIVFSTLLLLVVSVVGLVLIGSVAGGENSIKPSIGLIELSGEITDQGSSSALSGSTSGARDMIEQLNKARLDKSIKAVVIRINSPGGSASASQEMYQAVQEVRKSGKPVICSMGDLAASGGYYVASGCDTIYANGSTLTGSIGVISQFLNYGALFKKIGLDEATFKSGQFKDAGSPTRPLTPAEKQLFQAMIMNVYKQFVNDVAKGRKGKLTRAEVLKLADGRVYSGEQAKANKLIDKLGGLNDAIRDAASRVGMTGEPKVKKLGSARGLLGSVLGSETDATIAAATSSAGRAVGEGFAESFAQQLRSDASASAPQAR